MEWSDHPILEFDSNPKAILSPSMEPLKDGTPPKAVLCFFNDVLKNLAAGDRLERVDALRSEIGENPIYRLEFRGQTLLALHPGVGAPLAVGFLEEMIALGARDFIACGGCGSLDKGIDAGYPVVLTGAVRDEGTSYHYLPAGQEARAHPDAIAALERTLRAHKLCYRLGQSWTTDAIYRETEAKRERRMAQGCVVVEMEAAAFFAAAEMRGVRLGQLVYSGDLVVPEGWDERAWMHRHSDREMLFWLAVEALAEL